jgi:uncharacterized lipoprotein NlpE involved in copper resistance
MKNIFTVIAAAFLFVSVGCNDKVDESPTSTTEQAVEDVDIVDASDTSTQTEEGDTVESETSDAVSEDVTETSSDTPEQ